MSELLRKLKTHFLAKIHLLACQKTKILAAAFILGILFAEQFAFAQTPAPTISVAAIPPATSPTISAPPIPTPNTSGETTPAPATPAASAPEPSTPAAPAAAAPAAQPTAQKPAPSASVAGNAISNVVKGFAEPTLAVITAALYVTQSISAVVLGWVSFLLDNLFQANVNLNPAGMDVVQIGWAVMRDIVNSLFILIILWIAFTIIFNLENLGGKKLLARVIIIALLVNFSLAMVTAVFGFTNALAKVFSDRINIANGGIAEFIIDKTKAQTVFQNLSSDQATQLSDAYKKAAEEKKKQQAQTGGAANAPANLPTGAYPYNNNPGWTDTLVASLGVKPARAVLLTSATGCGVGAMVGSIIPGAGTVAGCVGGAIIGALVDVVFKVSGTLFDKTLGLAVSLALGNLFLLGTIALILLGSLALLTRLVAEVLLSIFAPAAFMVNIIPVGDVKKYWGQWVNYLLQWAFFAPIFYFLFYLSLFMLQSFDKIAPEVTQSNLDFNRVFEVLFSFLFLWIAIKFARKSSGFIADTAISLGKTAGMVGLGAATSGASLGVAALARRAAPTLEKGMEAASKIPFVRTIVSPVSRGVTGYLESQKQKISDQRKGMENWSDSHLQQEYQRSILAERKSAIAQILAERNKLNLLSDDQVTQAIRLTGQFDPLSQRKLLFARPDLIRKEHDPQAKTDVEARRNILLKMKAEDAQTIDWKAVTKDRDMFGEIVKELFVFGSPDRLSQISSALYRQEKGVRKEVQDKFQETINDRSTWERDPRAPAKPFVDEVLADRYVRYLTNNFASGLTGFRLPTEVPSVKLRADQLFLQRQGISSEADIINEAETRRIIQRSEQGFFYGGNNIGAGINEAAAYLKNNAALMGEVVGKLKEEIQQRRRGGQYRGPAAGGAPTVVIRPAGAALSQAEIEERERLRQGLGRQPPPPSQ